MESNTTIYQSVRLHNVHLNSFSYVANHTVIIGATIGKFCSIGPNCRIGLGMHPSSDFVSTHPVFFSSESHVGLQFTKKNHFPEYEDISIGNDVWIGAHVLIKDGVTIGNGAIVGAGAVVTKDVEPYAIVAGIPAKLLKYRFSINKIEYLQSNQWWNKDIKELRANYKKYHHIENFVVPSSNDHAS
ncbi:MULTISPECIES: CatB-related O-acetyltransferase [unclassified Vibrio]|uniref:CatB-related O-acetyltransferase n=1 Tax=unclassified Vibrio TaxID=2614977 RepID=UPI000C83F843|nr:MULTISPECIES: CatB-related O-acetyltransferase [unclassified Vibrio]